MIIFKKIFLKIINKFNLYIVNSRYNKMIKKYKYVHVMFNDKFNKPFVDFLNSSFSQDEHIVLCKRVFDKHPFPVGANVLEITSLSFLKFPKCKKVICHSLFDNELINYLYRHKNILRKKAYWMIWGGDLYEAQRDKKNDFVRRNFKGYVSDTDGDCSVAKLKYNSNSLTFNAGYTFPITKEMLIFTQKEVHDYLQIQINNSCDKSTIEMLKILSKYKDENIRITTVLSYGALEFKNSIIEIGKDFFGSKFHYLDAYLPPKDYAQFLAQNDILVLNQDRQQGLGNCFSNLALGSKVYIKKEITTYNHFNSRGIVVFDTNEIKNMDFFTFSNYNADLRQNNMKLASIFFDMTYLKNLWEEVFQK